MSAELVLVTVNGVFMAYAYLWVYPSLPKKTWRAVMQRDLAISAAAVLVAGGLFWNTGTRFSLLLFDTNWFVFSLVSLAIIEFPLVLHFARTYDISLDDDPDS